MYDDIKEKSHEFICFDEAIYYSISKHYKNWIHVKIILVPIIGFILGPFYVWFKKKQAPQKNKNEHKISNQIV